MKEAFSKSSVCCFESAVVKLFFLMLGFIVKWINCYFFLVFALDSNNFVVYQNIIILVHCCYYYTNYFGSVRSLIYARVDFIAFISYFSKQNKILVSIQILIRIIVSELLIKFKLFITHSVCSAYFYDDAWV